MKKITMLCMIIFNAFIMHAQPPIYITNNGSTATPISVCNAAYLSASGCPGCTVYQWKLNGANVGNNSSSYTATQSGTYTCTGTNAGGTATSNAIVITIFTSSTVSISAGGPVTFCNNPQQVTLTATNGPGFSYQWYKRTHGLNLIINGATAQTYLPPVNANETYAVYVTNSQGCNSMSNEITVSYFTAPPPVPQTISIFHNQTWICPNGWGANLSLTKETGCIYQWKLNGNPISTNCSGGYSACIGPQTPGIYSCVITNTCGTATSDSVTITQVPTPVMGIVAGNATACTGSVTFSITNSQSLPQLTTYQWKKNGTAINGANGNSYNASNAGSYSCSVGIPECATVTTTPVTIYTVPNIITTNPTTFCSGGATLTACPAGSSYQWKKNGVTIAGATSVTYLATLTGSYSCVITPPGCSSATSNSLSITSGVSNPLIVAPNGYDDCNGGTVTLNVSNVNGATYQWGTQMGGDLAGEISSSFNAPLTDNYYCRVTESCGTSTVNAASIVRILPDQNMFLFSFDDQGDVCGSASMYIDYSNFTPYFSYQWLKNDTAVNGATSSYYTANQPGVYTCDISIPGCPNSYIAGMSFNSSFTITNIVSPLSSNIPISPTGTTSYCTGYPVAVSVPPCTGCSYKFYQKTGSTFSLVSYDSSAYVFTSYSSGTSYFYATIENECNWVNTPIDTVIFTQPFTATITPSGPTTFCGAVNATLNATTGAGYSYKWYKTNVLIPGATSSTYNATQPGSYYVRITDQNGCIAQSFTLTIIQFSTVPSTPISAYGPTTFCQGGSVTIGTSPVSGHTWQWKKNGNAISGAVSHNYTASAAGSYTVQVTNTCGTATSSAVTVTVNALPSATITPAGSTTFCSGGSVILNAPVAANRSYQWKKNGNIISGAALSSYTATGAGSYKAVVTNTATGCSKTTPNAAVVTVNALPAATITPQGPTTFCAGGSVILKGNTGTGLTYKWKKNNTTISGATQANYTATVAGSYKVQVTNSNGCTKLSSALTVSVPCREGEMALVDNFDVEVYPNPSSGNFKFETFNTGNEKTIVEIYDAIGKKVLTGIFYDSIFNVPDESLVPGVYSAVITNGANRKMLKLIRTN